MNRADVFQGLKDTLPQGIAAVPIEAGLLFWLQDLTSFTVLTVNLDWEYDESDYDLTKIGIHPAIADILEELS